MESMAFLHDGITLAVGTATGKLLLHDLRREGDEPRALTAHSPYPVLCVRFSHAAASGASAPAPVTAPSAAAPLAVLTSTKPSAVPAADILQAAPTTRPRTATVPSVAAPSSAAGLDGDNVLSPVRGPAAAPAQPAHSIKSSLLL